MESDSYSAYFTVLTFNTCIDGFGNRMARNNSILEIVFKVQAKLRHGEDIRLSGNVPVLGCDDIDRAIPLYTTSEDYPWWSTEDGK